MTSLWNVHKHLFSIDKKEKSQAIFQTNNKISNLNPVIPDYYEYYMTVVKRYNELMFSPLCTQKCNGQIILL